MYNRYVPQPDGSFRRSRAGEPEPPPQKPPQRQNPAPCPPPPAPPKQPAPPPKRSRPEQQRPQRPPQHGGVEGFLRQLLPKDFDTGDLMVVLLLLLMAGDCPEDRDNAILTLALYFLM